MNFPSREGFIPFHNFKTWYRIVGSKPDEGKYPLLCLHGGPGMSHDYLEPLGALIETGRQVVFYDQLGCGNSDHPHDPSLWSVKLYVEEVAAIRKSLGLDKVHLLGQSWGGFLAQEYMLTNPSGVLSLTLANSASSTKRWISEANRLRSELPDELQQVLIKYEHAGTTQDPEYAAATDVYYRRHLCRLDPWPECLHQTLKKMGRDPEVYNTMWGPSEFHCTGSLQNWDIEEKIHAISIPTLILSGRHDESTPAINQILQESIQNSKWVLFDDSSHTPHLEETEKYTQTLSQFLDHNDVREY